MVLELRIWLLDPGFGNLEVLGSALSGVRGVGNRDEGFGMFRFARSKSWVRAVDRRSFLQWGLLLS